MKKLTHKSVSEYIEREGYILLSKEYKNAKSKLKVKCDKGHIYEVRWDNFKQGQRCPICTGNIKLTHKSVSEYIESFGYELLSKEYKNNKSKLKVKCDKCHIYEVRWDNFQSGSRCPECHGNKRHTYDSMKYHIEQGGYILLSKEYKGAHSKLLIKCDKGHEYKSTWGNFQSGSRCPVCDREKSSSKPEKEIQEYVKTFNIKQINNDRTQILNPNTGCYLELDVFLPEINKAIEFNGMYWHSLSNVIEHDMIKRKECERIGIELLVIDEQNYMDNKDLELNKIKDYLNDVWLLGRGSIKCL